MNRNRTSTFYKIADGFRRAFTIDFRTLALFRVFVASIVLTDLYFRTQYFTAFFTDQGILPRAAAVNWFGGGSFSLYFVSGSTFFTGCLIAANGIAAIALMLGYRTRIATIATWFLLVSLHHRTSILSSGADDLLRLLLFWAIFLPIGARYSIDSATERAKLYTTSGIFNFASIAILMQVLYVYWVGALLKTHTDWHTDFTAVYYALNAEEYTRSLGLWVVENFSAALPFFTGFVYFLELFSPLLIVAPFLLLWFRLPVLILLISMHIGFLLLLNVGIFPFVSICSLLLFLPKEIWHKVSSGSWFNRNQDVVVFYDKNCDFCLKTVLLLKEFCMLSSIQVEPAQEDKRASLLLEKHDSWVIQKPAGEIEIEWSALVYLIGLSPIFFWVSWPLNLVVKLNLGKRLYHYIGDRRKILSRLTAKALPWRESTKSKRPWGQLAVTLFMVFCFYINLQSVFPRHLPTEPPIATDTKYVFGLWQRWDMFAPRPVQQTRWPIFEGITNDGNPVDIFRQSLGPAALEKPAHVLADYEYYRWRKYFERLYLRQYAYLRPYYVSYECNRWNAGKSRGKQISEITLKMGTEVTLLDSNTETQFNESMGTYSC